VQADSHPNLVLVRPWVLRERLLVPVGKPAAAAPEETLEEA